jgi:thiol-disulfide isomerase/thioredoxin
MLVMGMASTAQAATTQQNQQQQQQRSYYAEPKKYAVELDTANLTSNFRDWDTDLAIMFYAPWCKYCKQLSTTWEQIAILSADNKELVVGKYNCEQPAEHAEVCQKLGVDRYPSVYFLGFGNMHQAPRGNIFGKNPYPRLAYYNSDLYPEAIYDWVRYLSWLSSMQRRWYDFTAFITGKKSRHALKAERLKDKVRFSTVRFGHSHVTDTAYNRYK